MTLSDELVFGVLIILAVVSILISAFLVAHAFWLRAYREKSLRYTEAGRVALSRLVIDADRDPENLGILKGLPYSIQSRLVVSLSRSVRGEALDALRDVATELGVIERSERMLRSPEWWHRLYGARLLQSLNLPGRPFLPLLTDAHPAVRTQGAEWAGDYPDTVTVAALLDALRTGSADRLSVHAVEDALLRIGRVASGPLARFLADAEGEKAIPGLNVAALLPDTVFAEPAIRLCSDPHPTVRAKAADLLGASGGRAGSDVLVSLLTDDAPMVRIAAARALGHIGHWPAAPRLGELLRDDRWEVRRAAALSLRAMGSPGELLLRHYRNDENTNAADIARQILDLPTGVEVRG